MADTATTRHDLLLMETGSHDNDWGINLNDLFQDMEDAIKGTRTTATTGGTTTLTTTTSREPVQRVTGVLVSNAIIEVPAASTSWWMVKNETTGDFTLTVKVTGQTGIVVPQGETKFLRCNGTDVVDLKVASQHAAYSSDAFNIGTLAFASDAYTAAADNGFIDELEDSIEVIARIANANATTTPTLKYPAAAAAKTIVHADATALSIGDMVSGMTARFHYRLSTDKWHMTTLSASKFIRATSANTFTAPQTFQKPNIHTLQTLTDAATVAWDMSLARNAVLTMTASRTLGAPTGEVAEQDEGYFDVIMDATGDWVLTWNAAYVGSGGGAPDAPAKEAGATTRYKYQVRGANDVLVTKVWVSNRNSIGFWKEYDKGTYTNSTLFTQAHGLGRQPSLFECFIENQTTPDLNWSIGDRVPCSNIKDGADPGRGTTLVANATNVMLATESSPGYIVNKTTFAVGIITISRWKVIMRVYD